MKKKIKHIIMMILIIISFFYGIYVFLKCMISLIFDIKSDIMYFVKNLNEELLLQIFQIILLFIIIMGIIVFILFCLYKKDDIFIYITIILTIPMLPYLYIKEKRKDELINYRCEIKELIDCVNYFSDENLKTISKDEFYYMFIEKVNEQNERLHNIKKKIDKRYNIFNIIIQIFILFCGILSSLLF